MILRLLSLSLVRDFEMGSTLLTEAPVWHKAESGTLSASLDGPVNQVDDIVGRGVLVSSLTIDKKHRYFRIVWVRKKSTEFGTKGNVKFQVRYSVQGGEKLWMWLRPFWSIISQIPNVTPERSHPSGLDSERCSKSLTLTGRIEKRALVSEVESVRHVRATQ